MSPISIIPPPVVNVQVVPPGVLVIAAGNVGPRGPQGSQGQWVSLTQAEYDALSPPDPDTLYVIVN
jgi:hypothetical protein